MCCFVLHPMYISSPFSSHLCSYRRKVVQCTNVAMLLPRPVPCRLRRPLGCVHLHQSFICDIPLASRFGNLEFHLLSICVVFLVWSHISVLHLFPQCFDAMLLQSFVFQSTRDVMSMGSDYICCHDAFPFGLSMCLSYCGSPKSYFF